MTEQLNLIPKRSRVKKRITMVCDESRAVFYKNHERTGSSTVIGTVNDLTFAQIFSTMLLRLGYRVDYIEMPSKIEVL